MDNNPIPFPSLSRYNGEASPERRSDIHNPHARVKSSPSPVKLWLPAQDMRPQLDPLDLAKSPPSTPAPYNSRYIPPNSSPSYRTTFRPSPARTYTSGLGSPSRPSHGSLLTPPLTPSSSFNSASASTVTDTDFDGDVTPSTPSDSGSPLRWSSFNLRKSALNAPRRSVDEGVPGHSIVADLVARLDSVDLTPRHEKLFSFGDHDTASPAGKADGNIKKTSRFLVVQNVPRTASNSSIRAAFFRGNEVKAIYSRLLAQYGILIISYFDPRRAVRARADFNGRSLAELCGTEAKNSEDDIPMRLESVSPKQVKKVVGCCEFMDHSNGGLIVEVTGSAVDKSSIQQFFTAIGELIEFRQEASEGWGSSAKDVQTYYIEYYNTKDASNAREHFDDRKILGVHLRVHFASDVEDREGVKPFPVLTFPTLASTTGSHEVDLSSPQPRVRSLQEPESPTPKRGMDAELRFRPRSVSATEGAGCPDALWRAKRQDEQQSPISPSPNGMFFGDIAQFNADRQRSTSMGPGRRGYAGQPYEEEDAFNSRAAHQMYGSPYGCMAPDPSYQFGSYQSYPSPYTPYDDPLGHVGNHGQWVAPPSAPPSDYRVTPHPGHAHGYPQDHTDVRGRAGPTRTSRSFGSRSSGSTLEGTVTDVDSHSRAANADSFAAEKGISEKNQLNITMIENGLDTRTTVMIRNIPNKMSSKDLMTVINKVCPRRIDFMYLRMDFSNGCNVGYAFVNFITVQDLLLFAKNMLGVKWNMYSSEKALHLSYANYQGKEALVEKFKNSCIMDERDEWRPRIFFSDGPDQGLPEPFPAPTHLRRKERSANNRGALFVPGAHHHHGRHFGDNAHFNGPQQRTPFPRTTGTRF